MHAGVQNAGLEDRPSSAPTDANAKGLHQPAAHSVQRLARTEEVRPALRRSSSRQRGLNLGSSRVAGDRNATPTPPSNYGQRRRRPAPASTSAQPSPSVGSLRVGQLAGRRVATAPARSVTVEGVDEFGESQAKSEPRQRWIAPTSNSLNPGVPRSPMEQEAGIRVTRYAIMNAGVAEAASVADAVASSVVPLTNSNSLTPRPGNRSSAFSSSPRPTDLPAAALAAASDVTGPKDWRRLRAHSREMTPSTTCAGSPASSDEVQSPNLAGPLIEELERQLAEARARNEAALKEARRQLRDRRKVEAPAAEHPHGLVLQKPEPHSRELMQPWEPGANLEVRASSPICGALTKVEEAKSDVSQQPKGAGLAAPAKPPPGRARAGLRAKFRRPQSVTDLSQAEDAANFPRRSVIARRAKLQQSSPALQEPSNSLSSGSKSSLKGGHFRRTKRLVSMARCQPESEQEVEAAKADAGEQVGTGGEAQDAGKQGLPGLDEECRAIALPPVKLLLSVFSSERQPVILFGYPPAIGQDRQHERIVLATEHVGPLGKEVHFSHAGIVHRYNAVLNTLKHAGIRETGTDSGRMSLLWGGAPKPEQLREFQSFQKCNHFPASWHLGRKDLLWKNIRRCQQKYPDGRFDITPQAFVLPSHRKFWDVAREQEPKALWIWKPPNSSCGRGIRVIPSSGYGAAKSLAQIERKKGVVQRYIDRPLLLRGYKFDLRLYVVVTSYDPLKAYLFGEGLVRLATEPFSLDVRTLSRRTMHLTNYSVNKLSSAYVKNRDDQEPAMPLQGDAGELPRAPSVAACPEEEAEVDLEAEPDEEADVLRATESVAGLEDAEGPEGDTLREGDGSEDEPEDEENEETPFAGEGASRGPSASKWSLKDLQEYFALEGLDYGLMMERIKDLLVKTLIAAEPHIVSAWHTGANFRAAGSARRGVGPNQTCFELYGFDILVDETLKPWLLEVNTCPSLSSSSPLDKRLKTMLCADMLTLVGLSLPTGLSREESCLAPRRGTSLQASDSKARFARSHNMESIISCQLKDLGEAEWATILDAHDENMRRGHFERIFPAPESIDQLGELFQTPRYANLVLAKWIREGGEKCFLPENTHLRPKWLPKLTGFTAC